VERAIPHLEAHRPTIRRFTRRTRLYSPFAAASSTRAARAATRSTSRSARATIKGWDDGIEGMKVGGTRKLTIPAALAYGAQGCGGVIPPHAALVFEVELLEVCC
jgi:FKBP-type peptidyl-prolyl cis-trans isomerase